MFLVNKIISSGILNAFTYPLMLSSNLKNSNMILTSVFLVILFVKNLRLEKNTNNRSSRLEVFHKIGYLKISQNLQEKTYARASF